MEEAHGNGKRWLGLASILGWALLFLTKPAEACEERYGLNMSGPTEYRYVHTYCPTEQASFEACNKFASDRGWTGGCGDFPDRGYYEVGWDQEAGASSGDPFYFGGFYTLASAIVQPAKNAGPPKCKGQCFGDPINAGNANKYETKLEYRGEGTFPLWIEWTYNYFSSNLIPADAQAFGANRTFNYGTRVWPMTWAVAYPTMMVLRPDGKIERFRKLQPTAGWSADADVGSRLIELPGGAGWRHEDEEGRVELFRADGRLVEMRDNQGNWQLLSYDSSGRLDQVVDMHGRRLSFQYDAAGHFSGVALPDGRSLGFAYRDDKYLAQVEYQDASTVQYRYEEAGYFANSTLFGALTGVLDEEQQRYSSTFYEWDRAIGTHLGNGQDAHSATYGSAGDYMSGATIALPEGASRSLDFTVQQGTIVPTKATTSCAGCTPREISYTYDANGREDVVTDNGVVNDYDYDARGLLTRLEEAKTDTAGHRRRIQTDWHPDFRMPVERRVYDAADTLVSRQTWTYNTRGQVLARSQIDPAGLVPARVTTTAYCEQSDVTAGRCPLVGLPTSVDGPRTDVADTVHYSYYLADAAGCATAPATCAYRKGDLWKATNALGHVVKEVLRYDGGGRVLSSRDLNGVVTDYEYHPRGWLAATKVRGSNDSSEADDRITRIAYRPTGLIEKTTLPDGDFVRYAYDSAHRLTDVFDKAGNSVHYTLDAAGQRVQEDTKTASNALKRTLSRVYDAFGELKALKDSAQNATGYAYDTLGRLIRTTDPLGRIADQAHDPLSRLARTLQDVGGLNVQTDFAYDALDRLTQVTDPKRLTTHYRYNGLGDQIRLESPDTGITDFTYNEAGQLATRKDANDAVAHRYTYDALNRPKAVFHTASGPADVEYDYDTVHSACAAGETFALGRVAAMRADGTELKYCYDRFGQVVRKLQTAAGVSLSLQYAYTLGGQLRAMTYPDGAVVDYVRDAQGRIQEIGVKPAGGTRQVLLGNATYEPFGPASGWTYGNGRSLIRSHDLDYRARSIHDSAAGGLSLHYGYNSAGELIELKDALQSATLAKYDYDPLSRLTVTRDGPTGTALETYGYDATGNRTSLTNGAGTQAYSYPADSHRLGAVAGVARGYDAVGNTTHIGGAAREFVYNTDDRLSQVKQAGLVKASYRYNARGERVARADSASGPASVLSLYDEAGHWVGDYSGAGVPLQQAVWMDDTPAGLLAGAAAAQKLHYLQADHLGTPRAVIDPARNVAVWAWDAKGEAFGNSVPNQDPDQDGAAFVLDMRFPGQRYDAASGLNYNYFRDYDPTTGRYTQSDPMGLMAGVSTYGYVSGTPLAWSDMFGLLQWTTNPVVWSPTLAPGLQTRTFPGDGISTVTGSILARTTLDWSISSLCVCGGGGYSLGEYKVNFSLIVFLRRRFDSPDQRRETRRAELDHVRDFSGWIEGEKEAAREMENSMRQRVFSTASECEKVAQQSMQQLLEVGAKRAAVDSAAKWDASGRHTENVSP